MQSRLAYNGYGGSKFLCHLTPLINPIYNITQANYFFSQEITSVFPGTIKITSICCHKNQHEERINQRVDMWPCHNQSQSKWAMRTKWWATVCLDSRHIHIFFPIIRHILIFFSCWFQSSDFRKSCIIGISQKEKVDSFDKKKKNRYILVHCIYLLMSKRRRSRLKSRLDDTNSHHCLNSLAVVAIHFTATMLVAIIECGSARKPELIGCAMIAYKTK